ncbi:hypothetical protein [Persicitalea sp.]|uniref:hypothetical protein n=1 Tax=Persicitalea sp. TaxID=3100273 RepID=UPI00359485C9
MPGSLNQPALKQYAADFTEKVLDDFYADQSSIDGQQILTLTPVRQVNLGIVSRIFDKWQADALAFRSQYFDFEREEVKGALQEFMNTVSRHIAIKRDDLQPLLLEATEDALRLLFAPSDYFEGQLRALPNFTFDKSNAQDLSKYTQIHAGVAKNLALRLSDSGSDFVYVNQALNWLGEITNSGASLDDQTTYVEQFSSVVPLAAEDILRDYERSTPLPAATVDDVPPAQENKSFFDTALEVPQDNTAVRPPDPVAVQPELVSTTVDIERESTSDDRPTSTGVNSLNSRFKVNTPTHTDETNYGNVSPKVDSIFGSVALGQRFMFVNQLFERNSDAFDEAIRELDRADTFEDAKALMINKFSTKYNWNPNSDAVKDLTALVKRKFN